VVLRSSNVWSPTIHHEGVADSFIEVTPSLDSFDYAYEAVPTDDPDGKAISPDRDTYFADPGGDDGRGRAEGLPAMPTLHSSSAEAATPASAEEARNVVEPRATPRVVRLPTYMRRR